jgi:hypothetical protein
MSAAETSVASALIAEEIEEAGPEQAGLRMIC